MTALIAPPVAMQHALGLSLTTAIAVQSAISSVAGFRRRDQIDIRWPNDLLLNARKCGGILIETASNPATPSQPATLRYAVIGIGINVNHTSFPPELDADRDLASSRAARPVAAIAPRATRRRNPPRPRPRDSPHDN